MDARSFVLKVKLPHWVADAVGQRMRKKAKRATRASLCTTEMDVVKTLLQHELLDEGVSSSSSGGGAAASSSKGPQASYKPATVCALCTVPASAIGQIRESYRNYPWPNIARNVFDDRSQNSQQMKASKSKESQQGILEVQALGVYLFLFSNKSVVHCIISVSAISALFLPDSACFGSFLERLI